MKITVTFDSLEEFQSCMHLTPAIIDRMAKAEAELAVIHDRIARLNARLNDKEMRDINMERDYGTKNPFALNSDIEINYIRELFGLKRSDTIMTELAKLNADRAGKEN